MAKSIWKGEISFGLVSIPVSLISIEEDNDIHFHLLDSKTKSRVRYQRVSEETGKEIPWEGIVKGYEYDKDSYIIVDEKEFEKAGPELFKTINIEEFVDFNEIDSLYFTKPYYLTPDSKNKKAYVLLREALKKTNKAGVAKVIIRTKESLSLILPHEHALLLYLIHFKDEIREEEDLNVPKENLTTYKVTEKEIKMATDLIKEMSTKWKPEKYHNDYRQALQQWLDQQVEKETKAGKKASQQLVKNSGAVVDFISLLKDSMKQKKTKNKAVKNKPKLKKS
ncbi:non-homologous end joining protein Ku [Legionella antarctica]|uniref:Non-homologous end joining protein Ku n=1 Tax=Legionella antarctica TaxID=2708020 RepID=A0A6F8T2R7_9GAMM|nr:Ku protein [Legionella antarctica]BCA94761.1 non-homologous end joining protein Ku [Legionella antarctica]